jgi:hypothetical protein
METIGKDSNPKVANESRILPGTVLNSFTKGNEGEEGRSDPSKTQFSFSSLPSV